ncbi:MAG: TonB-dependent receptor [Hyphomonadaceae bacterium]|nr:TonB-dependent receptor [Hyphomonadaceae bacterium]
MKTLNQRPALLLGASLAALLASPVAMAQETTEEPAAQDMKLGTVTVTAQKREESINEVPMAIAAFSGDDLDILGLADTRDLASLVPGLTFAQSSSSAPIYTLRGVGFNSPDLAATSPVGVYIDEASFAYPYMSKGLAFDVERVEVLKGPQGTLYGRNTTGGLINYITNKPTDEFEAYAKANVGNYDSYGLEAVLSGPLSDTLSARAAFKYVQSDEGWQESISRPGVRNGDVDRWAGRLTLLFTPNERLDATLSVNVWQDNSDAQAGQPIQYNPEVFTDENEAQALAIFGGAFPPGTTGQEIVEALYVQPGISDNVLSNPSATDADWASPFQPGAWPGTTFQYARPETGIDSEMVSVTGRIDYDLTDTLTFTSITNYASLDRDDVTDRGGTQFELLTVRALGEVDSFSQEFRLTGSAYQDQLEYIIGAYYSDDDLVDTTQVWAGQWSTLNRLRLLASLGAQGAGAPADVVAEIQGGFRDFENFSNQSSETTAVFGQLSYQLTDAVKLTGGLRYTNDESTFQGCSRDLNGDENVYQTWDVLFGTSHTAGECVTFLADFSGFLPPEGASRSLEEDNVSARLSVDWQATEDALLYASVSRGFKSGGFPNLSAFSEVQYEPTTQEELMAYEVGAKLSPADSLQINASAYFYDYTDKQLFGTVLDPIFTTLTRLVNIPESEVYGAELDVTWVPVEDVYLKLGGSYLKTEINEYVGFNSFGAPVDFAGYEFAYSPEWQFNALATKRFDLSDNLEGRATLDISHSSEQQADFQGLDELKIDSYTLLGGRLALSPKDERWEVAVFGRNLTDEYYWTNVGTRTDTTIRWAGMPRTYGLEVTFNY